MEESEINMLLRAIHYCDVIQKKESLFGCCSFVDVRQLGDVFASFLLCNGIATAPNRAFENAPACV